MSIKKIYFVRHGESNGNAQEQVSGKNESLSPRGLIQAEQCAQRFITIDVEKLIVSDFTRAQQTADAIASVKTLSPETNSAFGEIMPPSSLIGMKDNSEKVLSYRKERNENVENPSWKPEDGENHTDVLRRIHKAKKLLVETTAQNIVVVSHGIYLQMFAATVLLNALEPSREWLRVAQTFALSNTGITLFTIEEEKWRLVTWNDHAHFAE